jgi:transcription elongation factor GreA
MSEETTYLTAEGAEELRRELDELKNVRRPDLAVKLKEAVAMGDLKENADYHDTREKMGLVDGQIQRLETILRNAVIVENTGKTDEVQIGSTVTIRDLETDEDETYHIVGAAESNPREGKISQKSPIGAALLGRKKGAKVTAKTPSGEFKFKIMKIE